MYQLIGKWTILSGNEEKAHKALKHLAIQVQNEEPGTLIYVVYLPDFAEISLPTPPSGEVIFFEAYKDKEAFNTHINGPIFKNFTKTFGHLFLNDFSNPSQVYFSLEVLKQLGGFIRNTPES